MTFKDRLLEFEYEKERYDENLVEINEFLETKIIQFNLNCDDRIFYSYSSPPKITINVLKEHIFSEDLEVKLPYYDNDLKLYRFEKHKIKKIPTSIRIKNQDVIITKSKVDAINNPFKPKTITKTIVQEISAPREIPEIILVKKPVINPLPIKLTLRDFIDNRSIEHTISVEGEKYGYYCITNISEVLYAEKIEYKAGSKRVHYRPNFIISDPNNFIIENKKVIVTFPLLYDKSAAGLSTNLIGSLGIDYPIKSLKNGDIHIVKTITSRVYGDVIVRIQIKL